MATARDSFDPTDFGPLDDTVEEDDGEGNKVTLLKDWSKPPFEKRCDCQKIFKTCSCGKGAKPQGQCLQLYWDKVS